MASREIPDPEAAPSAVTISTIDFDMPEDWRKRIKAGSNFKVELVLHVEAAVQTPSTATKWRCKWLSLTRLSD